MVLKAAPGIGDQRRVLLKPLRKPIFVVRSRNSRRSSVGAGPPIVSLKTIKIQRFRCHFVMVWTETIFRNLPRSGRAPLVPFGFPWPLGPLPLAFWVPLGPLGGWGGGGPWGAFGPKGSAPCRSEKRASRTLGGGADSAGENILGRRHARKRIWIRRPSAFVIPHGGRFTYPPLPPFRPGPPGRNSPKTL